MCINDLHFAFFGQLDHMHEARLDAILTLLTPVQDSNIDVSEADWAEITERQKRYKEGKTEMIDAFESVERLKAMYNPESRYKK